MGSAGLRALRAVWCVLALTLSPSSAAAFEVSGGASAGGILAGTVPHFAVSAHASISWPMNSGLLFAVKEIVSVLPPTHVDAPGVYEQTGAAIGYAADRLSFGLGPSFSFYSIPSCGIRVCGHVSGLALGGSAGVNLYVHGNFGFSVHGALDWLAGKSLALPGDDPREKWRQQCDEVYDECMERCPKGDGACRSRCFDGYQKCLKKC